MVKIEHYTVLCRQRRIVNGLLAYNLQALLPLQAARATRFVSQNRYSWRRHTGNYCDDHCLPCSAESAPLPKSTSSRYYRLTRLHVRSIDSSRLCRSTRLQCLSIDSIDFKVYMLRCDITSANISIIIELLVLEYTVDNEVSTNAIPFQRMTQWSFYSIPSRLT